MQELSPLAATLGAGNILQAIILWRLNRPAQKAAEKQNEANSLHTQQQAIVNSLQAQVSSMLQSAQATPELVKTAQALLAANAALQQTIIKQSSDVEVLSERVADLEDQVKDLTARCQALAAQADRVPPLERHIAELQATVRDREALIAVRDGEIAQLNILLAAAAKGQERAEGAMKEAERLLAERCPTPDFGAALAAQP